MNDYVYFIIYLFIYQVGNVMDYNKNWAKINLVNILDIKTTIFSKGV